MAAAVSEARRSSQQESVFGQPPSALPSCQSCPPMNPFVQGSLAARSLPVRQGMRACPCNQRCRPEHGALASCCCSTRRGASRARGCVRGRWTAPRVAAAARPSTHSVCVHQGELMRSNPHSSGIYTPTHTHIKGWAAKHLKTLPTRARSLHPCAVFTASRLASRLYITITINAAAAARRASLSSPPSPSSSPPQGEHHYYRRHHGHSRPRVLTSAARRRSRSISYSRSSARCRNSWRSRNCAPERLCASSSSSTAASAAL